MAEWLLTNEPLIRLGVFGGVLGLMLVLQALWPRRAPTSSTLRRWFANLSLTFINTLVLRGLFLAASVTAVGFAWVVQNHGWGLLAMVGLPFWAEILVSFLILDLVVYGQHVVFHYVPVLWRLHRVHHADLDFDTTTGVRFHPVEIVLSMLLKFAVIVAVGVPAAAVLIFEVVLNATSLFNHANLRLPAGLDRLLRLVLVTPDMHRVHHSIHRDETDSNFGFNLPWWDRLFRTYRAQPRDGHEAMTIGLPLFRERGAQSLLALLVNPFKGTPR